MTHVLTKSERERIVSAWRAVYPTVETATPVGEIHRGQFCFDFQSIEIDDCGHARRLIARKFPQYCNHRDGSRVDLSIAAGEHNEQELDRLAHLLNRRGNRDEVIPVTIGYVVDGSTRGRGKAHYIALPALGSAKRHLHYVFN